MELIVGGGKKPVFVIYFLAYDFVVSYGDTEIFIEVLRLLFRSWVLEGGEYKGGY